MFAQERQKKICEMIREGGAVSTSNLMALFDVSIETVRRDLLKLEREHKLQRVHGGAVTLGEVLPYLSLESRLEERRDQKAELSGVAMAFISEGDVIGVDAGSTAVDFADQLAQHFNSLTVVTSCMDVFNRLCRHPSISAILCAGHYSKSLNGFYGPLVVDSLKKLHMQKFFMFPAAVSLKYGICDHEPHWTETINQYCASSEEIYILADSSKFEKSALMKVSEMNPQYTYITDSSLSPELRELYRENQIRIIAGEKK